MQTLERLKRKVHEHAARGTDVACQLCGWQGSKWYDTQICPRCKSRARTRLIPYALEHFAMRPRALLHIGPSVSEVAFFQERYNPDPYYRLDIKSRPHVNLVGDICAIPLDPASVDSIVIWHVLEHISDDHAAIAEMHRVLMPGGKVLVSVPIHPKGRAETYEDSSIPQSQWLEIHGHDDHCRSCGLDYYQRFETAGLGVQTLNTWEIAASERARHGLSDSHVAWCCTK